MSQAPHNIEAEQALLGAILYRNEVYSVACDGLRPEHFFEPVHARIYEAATTLILAGKLASPVTLKTYFERDETLQEIGGTAYLASLAGAATTIVNAPEYARLIRNLAMQRDGQCVLEEAIAGIIDLPVDQPAEEYLNGVAANLTKLAESGATRKSTVSVGDASGRALDEGAEAFRLGGRRPGSVSSGLAALDDLIGGFAPGSLTIAGARPSMGKTAQGLSIASNCAFEGRPALFVSLEMTATQIGARHLAMCSGVPFTRIEQGRFSEQQYSSLVKAREDTRKLPLIIDDRAGANIADIGAMVSRTARRHPDLALVVVDYIGLISPGERYRGNKVSEISEITAALKGIAKRHSVAVIALSQLNRSVENRDNKRPALADLRNSGSIEQDGDLILFPYRDEYYLERELDAAIPGSTEELALRDRLHACQGRMEIAVAKNRQGRIGVAHVSCDMTTNRIFDLAARERLAAA